MLAELRDLLFIDIETVSCTGQYDTLSERMKAQWARKASYLRREQTLTDEEIFHDRAAIYAEFGKIVCIAVGKFMEGENGVLALKTKAYYGDDEKVLLTELKAMLDKLPSSAKLCAHNGKEFDYPYMCRRMLVNEISLPGILNIAGKKPWDIPHLDTMEMWKFGDYKNFTSLDLLATIFNIPSSKGDIDGSQVSRVYHEEKDLIKIKDYCLRDVVVLAALYLKLRGIALPQELVVHQAPS